MCFSATASFAAASLAGTAGVFTLSRARGARELPLAGIPALFGLHQAIEGALWLTLPQAGDAALAAYLANSFAIVALVVWPAYAAIAVALVEENARRRMWIWLTAPFGLVFALYSARDIWSHPYHALRTAHSLCYINNSPYPDYALAVYVAGVCGGFLLSSHRLLKLFGAVLTAGLAATLYAYLAELVSVWCFFAAIASLILVVYFLRRNPVSAGLEPAAHRS